MSARDDIAAYLAYMDTGGKDIKQIIFDELTPIVRCRDCRYYDEIIHACDHPNVTPLRGDCPENWLFSCFDNGFCAWGRRADG